MLPYLNLFGRVLPTYSLLGVAGVLLGLLVALARCKRFQLSASDCAYIYVMGGVGAVIGAKLLYLIPLLPQMIADLPLLGQNPSLFFARYLTGGMVFYGGFLGGILGAWLEARYFRLRFSDFFPVLVPTLPLIHALGRVGCFCAGCCYGVEAAEPWGIPFTHAIAAPNGVPLLPVQLYECAAELMIFLFLLWYVPRAASKGGILRAYMLAYAPVRFVLEFFRGDVVRGIYGPLSTSQWISLAVMAAAVVWLVRERRENRS